jgi:hypothetical protein
VNKELVQKWLILRYNSPICLKRPNKNVKMFTAANKCVIPCAGIQITAATVPGCQKKRPKDQLNPQDFKNRQLVQSYAS